MFLQCRNQLVISPMGGAVDINHLAVHAAMDLYGVEDRRACFEKVCTLAVNFIGRKQ